MKKITAVELQKQLQALADQVGAKRFEQAKMLVLENAVITDSDGNILAPEQIDYSVTIKPAAPAEASADATPALDPAIATDTAKAITSEIRKGFADLAASAPRKAAPVTSGVVVGRSQKPRHMKSAEAAFRFGNWAAAACGNHKAAQRCRDLGIGITKGATEGVNTAGGFLVPDEFASEIISLREQYGVFRANASVKPMSRDTLYFARRTGNLTAHAVAEAAAGTESTQAFDRIGLVAKKFLVLTTVSNELDADNAVQFGDDLANEIAYAFALKEDDCGFAGTGTSTYGGIVGAPQALVDAASASYSASGIVQSAGSTLATVTIAELRNLVGRLPAYADRGNAKWFVHKSVANQVFERLSETAGGVTANEIRDGAGTLRFFGYPVVFAQAMASAVSNSSPYILFGDLAQSSYFGDRSGMSVSFSDSALNAFEQDEMAVRGSARFDIVNANVGSSTSAGSLVGLIST